MCDNRINPCSVCTTQRMNFCLNLSSILEVYNVKSLSNEYVVVDKATKNLVSNFPAMARGINATQISTSVVFSDVLCFWIGFRNFPFSSSFWDWFTISWHSLDRCTFCIYNNITWNITMIYSWSLNKTITIWGLRWTYSKKKKRRENGYLQITV